MNIENYLHIISQLATDCRDQLSKSLPYDVWLEIEDFDDWWRTYLDLAICSIEIDDTGFHLLFLDDSIWILNDFTSRHRSPYGSRLFYADPDFNIENIKQTVFELLSRGGYMHEPRMHDPC